MASGGAFERQFRVFVEKLNADASKQIAAAARAGKAQIIAENRARGGLVPGVRDAVDGVAGAPYERVKPDGQIVQLFDYRHEIIAALFAELRARSPIGPAEGGHYRDSHFAMLDGRALQPLTVPPPEMLAAVQQIIITNPMPYSRRLEFGLTKSGRAFVRQVEPHIFENSMEAVRQRYRAVGKFSYRVIDLAGAYTLRTNRMLSRAHNPQRKRGAGARLTYPAIQIDRIGM